MFNHSNVNQHQIYEKKIYKSGVNENQLYLENTNVVKKIRVSLISQIFFKTKNYVKKLRSIFYSKNCF